MPKYYIAFQNKRNFYAVEGVKVPVHVNLNERDIISMLQKLSGLELLDVKGNSNNLKLVFDSGVDITIAKKAFGSKNDKYDRFFGIIQNKLKEYKARQEKKNIKEYSKKIGGYTPSINRRKSAKLGTLLALSGISALALISSYLEGNSITLDSTEELPPLPKEDMMLEETYSDHLSSEKSMASLDSNDLETVTSPNKSLNETNTIMNETATVNEETTSYSTEQSSIYTDANSLVSSTTNTENSSTQDFKESYEAAYYSIDIPFENRANDGKLAETIEYCGAEIEYYANRYGLNYELACAQITQERPNIINGYCENPCQITYSIFVGTTMRVPVYDENGLTGEYDEFEITKELLDSKEGNLMTGLGFTRNSVDKLDSLRTGLFSYNQGDNSLSNACKYYGLDYNSFLGEDNGADACELIANYYRETKDYTYGDPNYLPNVFSYLELDNRGSKTIDCFVNGRKNTYEINNTLEYNDELSR